ncbi:phosphatidylglycerophosphatase A family protein [Silvimonas iriomotensis]|uniref:Phosphatidylglycerophosphatase A n=1 Tax=Silvimonas iriomotensis TaxID=449662 RepID=A0ABQ2P6X1_9NEIS|nr:phosphatidylglycerophosphatase A [Silvimonas iriomotensis]GGP19748.1 phosphatidylglycerophosphatase A [Silvimonas iriomotensis]
MGKSGAVPADWRFCFSHPAHFIALGFGSGVAPKAPGTFGSLAAIPLYAAMLYLWPPIFILSVTALVFVIGWWAASKTGHDLGVHDHGAIVIDEIVAMWLVLLVVPVNFWWWIAAFAAFRLFDIWKPWPIRWFDAKVPGGLGVMVDDIVAAFYAVVVLLLAQMLLLRG